MDVSIDLKQTRLQTPLKTPCAITLQILYITPHLRYTTPFIVPLLRPPCCIPVILLTSNIMPSTSAKLANTIHIRDFVDDVLADRTQPNKRNYFEIHTDVNIFQEDGFYDSGITVEPIHTCIRTYLTASERGLYVPNAFFYAEGRFKAAVTTENKLEITVHALGLQRCDILKLPNFRSF